MNATGISADAVDFGAGATEPGSSWPRFEVIVPVATLIYVAVLTLVLSIFESPAISTANPWPLIADAFALVFLGAAFLVWRSRQIGYVVAVIMSALILVVFMPDVTDGLTGFADLATFAQALTLVTAALLTITYSVLGIRLMRNQRPERRRGMTMPVSASIVLIAVGVLIGGLLIGTLASGVQARLLANAGTIGDVSVARGAANPKLVQPYSPPTLNVKAGATVSWVNRDTVTHTVTSQPGGSFDSGGLAAGAIFRFTFARAGTYSYYCTVHSWMKGTVVVSGG